MNQRRFRPKWIPLLLACFAPEVRAATVANPFLWADVPDLSIIRVGKTYYMSSTTMHMAPGVPIMESTDLVHWKMASYAYDTLANIDKLNLNNGQNAYSNGSWASSLRYKNGTFYVLFMSFTTNKSYIYYTTDVHKTPWNRTVFNTIYYDPSLFFDDDGKNYVACGNGGTINLIQLNSTLTGEQSGGVNRTIISSSQFSALNATGLDEGSHLEKVNGYYYNFNICWPSGSPRSITAFRSQSLTGTFEGKIVLQSSGGHDGVAQGSVVQMADSSWMGYAFTDQGAVGRCPWLVPVTWSGNWPVFNGGNAPTTLNMNFSNTDSAGYWIISSDDFTTRTMNLEWQWNHNPDNANWSLSARPGYYRITTSRVDSDIKTAKNTLTQRAMGPKTSGRVALDASGLKDGDIAGLAAFQDNGGFVAVKMNGTTPTVVMYNNGTQIASANLSKNRVYLRVDMDFTSGDKATFYYSTDSTNWTAIGNSASMAFNYQSMFMGARFGLFCYATKSSGGYADFDWYKVGPTVASEIDLHKPDGVVSSRIPASPSMSVTRVSEFAGRITVGWRTDRSGRVEFLLADPSGKILERLDEIASTSGNHSVQLTTALPGGHYLLVSRMDGRTFDARPVVLVR
jgi:beta-xylosidase